MMTPNEFNDWLSTAKRGDSITYYIGHVGELFRKPGSVPDLIDHIQSIAFRVRGDNQKVDRDDSPISLVQRRHGSEFEYIAQRNGKKLPLPAAISKAA